MDAVARFVVTRFVAARERHAAHVRSVPRLFVDPSHPLSFALADAPVESLPSGAAGGDPTPSRCASTASPTALSPR